MWLAGSGAVMFRLDINYIYLLSYTDIQPYPTVQHAMSLSCGRLFTPSLDPTCEGAATPD